MNSNGRFKRGEPEETFKVPFNFDVEPAANPRKMWQRNFPVGIANLQTQLSPLPG